MKADNCWLHYNVIPLFLMLTSPPTSFILTFWGRGVNITITGFKEYIVGTYFSWSILVITLAWAILWMKYAHKTSLGPPDRDGTRPVYPNNFFEYYCVSTVVAVLLAVGMPAIGRRLYEEYHTVLGTGAVFGLFLSLYFYIEGLNEPFDHGHIFRFFTGTRLRMTVFGVDWKILITYMHSTMAWHFINILFYVESLHNYGFNWTSLTFIALSVTYFGRVFYWGRGMYGSLDMLVEHLGFYNGFGCFGTYLIIYVLPTLAIVDKSPTMPTWAAIILGVAGCSFNCLTYMVDKQKLDFRENYGLKKQLQPRHIAAKFVDKNGKTWESPLLMDGFWAQARHLNYTFEVSFLTIMTVLTLGNSLYPLIFLVFLYGFAISRVFRNEENCSKKYGHYWKQYCIKVPYKLIPYVF